MKYHLFIDNFRGFSDTFISLADVNFLVGENSTGKTSVLGLLRLFLNSRSLLMANDFGDEGMGFGNFPDMVSIHSHNLKRFDVGFIAENRAERKNEPPTFGYIFTFMEDKGLPRLAKCTICMRTEQVSLRFIGRTVYFKREKHPDSYSVNEIRAVFSSERGDDIGKRAGFERLVLPPSYPGDIPPLIALSFVQSQVSHELDKRKRKEGMEFTIYPDFLSFSSGLCWVAPIRTKPKRTYDVLAREFSPEGEHTPYLLRRILRTKSQAVRFREAIRRAGEGTGLFQDVEIRNFGSGATAPFEVDIVIDGKALNINTVGYGVSQSLPVLVELLTRRKGSWFAIQQPEVHLHPRAQAAFGDVIFEMAAQDEKCFVIETHSDFMMDRFRMQYKSKQSKKPESQVLFFERKEKHNSVTPLLINDAGELPEDQPENYRRFFIHEQMNLLGL